MGCLSSARRTLLQARLATKTAQLTAAYAAYDAALANADVKTFRLDTAEAATYISQRGLNEMADRIRVLENEIDSINQKLNNTGLSSLNLRRRG